MRPLLLMMALLIATTNTVSADIDTKGKRISIFTAKQDWKLTLPASDWVVETEKRRKGGGGYYYHLTSKKTGLNFSVFFDKTNRCNSAKKCRDLFWSNPGPKYKGSQDVVKKDVNGFSVLQFYIDKPMGYPLVQSNISAHNYRNGFWVDIHMSIVDKKRPKYSAMNKVLRKVKIEKINP